MPLCAGGENDGEFHDVFRRGACPAQRVRGMPVDVPMDVNTEVVLGRTVRHVSDPWWVTAVVSIRVHGNDDEEHNDNECEDNARITACCPFACALVGVGVGVPRYRSHPDCIPSSAIRETCRHVCAQRRSQHIGRVRRRR